jgi:hypothetical protein
MVINNITAKHKALLEVIWEMSTEQEIVSFIKTLPYRDMRDMAYLIELVQAGGDQVDNVDLARAELDRIQKL